MKLEFLNEPLIDENAEIIHEKDENSPIVTLRDALSRSLNHLSENTNASAEVKYKRYKALKKLSEDENDWSVEELALIKEAVGQFPWVPWAHGYICDLIDGNI